MHHSRLFWYAMMESLAIVGMALYVAFRLIISTNTLTFLFQPASLRFANVLHEDRQTL